MGDLPAAGLAVTDDQRPANLLHEIEERLAHLHGDGVFFLLVAVRAGDAAAGGVRSDGLQRRHQLKHLHPRPPQAVPLVLAGHVVAQGERDGAQVKVQAAFLVQKQQEFVEVVGVLGHQAGIGIVHVEQLGGLLFEREGAACGSADDGDALAGVSHQAAHVVLVVLAGGFELAVRKQGQAAAVLRRDDHLEAVGFQHAHCRPSHARLVILGRAAVEINHLGPAVGPGIQLAPVEPGGEFLPAEGREGRFTVDVEGGFGQPAGRLELEEEVGQRSHRLGNLPQGGGARHQVVAQAQQQRHFALLDQRGAHTGIHLGDLDAGWAGHVASAAAAAVIYRMVGGRLAWLAEAPCLGSLVLRPWEQVGDRGYGANGGADIAFDALVEAQLNGKVGCRHGDPYTFLPTA